jgi:Ca2+-binding EF-hand superfamily protein
MRPFVWERRKIVLGIAGLFASKTVLAQDASQSNARKERNVAAGEKEAKKLLLLMDKDQNGKVSRQEFMAFMEEEFERLDKDRNGELDVQELTQSRVRSSGAIHR